MDKHSETTEQKSAPRRRLLKTLALGGSVAAIPQEWAKPSLQTVLVPAHARSSVSPLSGSGDFLVHNSFPGEMQIATREKSSILDALISEAHAQASPFMAYCERAPERGDGWFRVMLLVQGFESCYAALLWDTHLQLTAETSDGFASAVNPVPVSETCGVTFDELIGIGLKEFNDLNAPTSGTVIFVFGEESGEIPVLPGGAPLSINCVNACSSSSSSFSFASSSSSSSF